MIAVFLDQINSFLNNDFFDLSAVLKFYCPEVFSRNLRFFQYGKICSYSFILVCYISGIFLKSFDI